MGIGSSFPINQFKSWPVLPAHPIQLTQIK